MKIIEDNFEELAKNAIAKHGNCEEHNYDHFVSLGTSAKKTVFVSFDEDMGILALKSKKGKVWYMLREVLAPKEKKAELLITFADHVINELNNSRLEVELDDDSKKELDEKLGTADLRACKVNFYLEWPIFDMKTWEGDVMPGKSWKKIRNIRNRFYKEHKVEVKHPNEVDKKELRKIVLDWKKNRKAEDFAYHQQYLNVIDEGFIGFDEVRVLIVDNRPCAITGGWKIPNSNDYYSCFGVLDYSVPYLGEMANLDDLTYLKTRNYNTVNFGGSDETLLDFKKKFKPAKIYKTHTYSIMKENIVKSRLKLKMITDIEECKRLFEKFSTKRNVWDLWDISYSFTQGYKNKPVFILGTIDGKEIGILHLELSKDEEGDKLYDFFGGDYPEGRTFFIEDKTLIKKFLDHIPDYVSLEFIDPEERKRLKELKEDELSYSIDLERYNHDLSTFFGSFNKKHRKNMKYDLRHIEDLKPEIEWNKIEHLDRLAELNRVRFKEESNFTEPEFYESMKLLIDAAKNLNILHLLSIKINGKVEAAQVALFYKNTYHVLTGGSNPDIKNMGKFMIIEHVKHAISIKASKVDFMSTESGWKKLWNLDETMLYRYENEDEEESKEDNTKKEDDEEKRDEKEENDQESDKNDKDYITDTIPEVN